MMKETQSTKVKGATKDGNSDETKEWDKIS